MPLIFSTLLSLLTGSFGAIVDWARRKQEIQATREENLQRLQLQALKNEGETEAAESRNSGGRLRATSAIFKYGTFFMWFYPFIIGQVRPAYAHAVFENLLAMPAWYTQSCVIIMFAIWGISVSAPAVQTVFSSLGSFLQEKRDHKERVAAINRGVVFDSLRTQVKGGLSQEFVNAVNKALDAGESPNDNR